MATEQDGWFLTKNPRAAISPCLYAIEIVEMFNDRPSGASLWKLGFTTNLRRRISEFRWAGGPVLRAIRMVGEDESAGELETALHDGCPFPRVSFGREFYEARRDAMEAWLCPSA